MIELTPEELASLAHFSPIRQRLEKMRLLDQKKDAAKEQTAMQLLVIAPKDEIELNPAKLMRQRIEKQEQSIEKQVLLAQKPADAKRKILMQPLFVASKDEALSSALTTAVPIDVPSAPLFSIGTRVYKNFQAGWFHGNVTDYHPGKQF